MFEDGNIQQLDRSKCRPDREAASFQTYARPTHALKNIIFHVCACVCKERGIVCMCESVYVCKAIERYCMCVCVLGGR